MAEQTVMSSVPDLNAKDRKRLVLIVEDEFVNRELLKAYLQEEYEILCAETAEEAIRAIRDHLAVLSLVLLDLRLPDRNGLEVLREIKKDSDMRRIPVIVL